MWAMRRSCGSYSHRIVVQQWMGADQHEFRHVIERCYELYNFHNYVPDEVRCFLIIPWCSKRYCSSLSSDFIVDGEDGPEEEGKN